jgi:ketosteroid isomerase-like protein
VTTVTEYAVFARFARTVHDDPMTDSIGDPAVRAFIDALNAGDRTAFQAALTPDATMADDGRERDLTEWTEKEIFSSQGHLEVETAEDDGRAFVANYSNSTWGAMRTRWAFTVRDGKVARFETGQA